MADVACAKNHTILTGHLVTPSQSSDQAVPVAETGPFPSPAGSSPSLCSVPTTATYSSAPVLHTPLTNRLDFKEKERVCLKIPNLMVRPGNTLAARQEMKLQHGSILPFSLDYSGNRAQCIFVQRGYDLFHVEGVRKV